MKTIAILILMQRLANFAQAQDSTSSPLAFSVVVGDYQYLALRGGATGNYLFGGLGFTKKLSPALSLIGGAALQAGPETGAWGPNIWTGVETVAGPILLDFMIGGIKDIGPIPSPWILGPGINILIPTKSGAFSPMVMATRATSGGPWYLILGFSASGLLF